MKIGVAALALLLAPAAALSQSRQLPPGAFASNVEFVGFTDLNGHIPFKTYSNAGLRVFDISDARLPREIGYFVPPNRAAKEGRAAGGEGNVSNGADVIVDTRGYIYMSDRSQGIWILRYTGPKPEPAKPVVRYQLAPTRIEQEEAERQRRSQQQRP